MDIEITEKAKKALEGLGATNSEFLRIMVKTGGCAGMTYTAEIDNKLKEDESVIFSDGGVRVVSDSESQVLLNGLRIDYSDDLITAGFRFTNPGSSNPCGCGASFTPVEADCEGGMACVS